MHQSKMDGSKIEGWNITYRSHFSYPVDRGSRPQYGLSTALVIPKTYEL